jgi:malonyl-CoA decarboxylase
MSIMDLPLNVSFLQELLNTVAERGRQFLPASLRGGKDDITDVAQALVSVRGEASGVAIARHILDTYRELTTTERRDFFRFLAETIKPDDASVRSAAEAYLIDGGAEALTRLQQAVESPLQEFFRRLNLAPGATAEIVAMRRDLLTVLPGEPSLDAVDNDLRHLLYSWFNRGFLVLRRIDWQTPAAILEKIIHYEAVHEIQGFEDLRRRLDPTDRRCFAFFHPSLVDEPLIFVEVALTDEAPESIQNVLNEERKGTGGPQPTVAVFYSISNCQEGLKSISFGNFLIKQVVEELAREQPQLKTFVTLSPVPGFARWLSSTMADDTTGVVSDTDRVALQVLADPGWIEEPEEDEGLKDAVLALAAHYFLIAKARDGRPVDPVARFHLGNGARLERINWQGDVSEKGLRESYGVMVNYRYDLKEIEKNHEAYANSATVVAARPVRQLLRAPPKTRSKSPAALPPPPDRSAADEDH